MNPMVIVRSNAAHGQPARAVTRGLWRAVLIAAVVLLGGSPSDARPARADQQPPLAPKDHLVVFVIDRSGSMSGERLRYTIEAAKLGVQILAGRLQIVCFSSNAQASPVFELPTQRREARAWLDRVVAEDDTRYLPALTAIAPEADAIVFLSDGSPSESSQEVIDFVTKHVRVPLHSIAVGATPEAEKLLAKMAAASRGSMRRVLDAPEVVEAFLQALQQVRPFRRYHLTADSLDLAGVRGELLAIGFDSLPSFSAANIERHAARLPHAEVHLARTELPQPTSVTVIAKPKDGLRSEVVVIRFDLPVASMRLARSKTENGRAQIVAESEFRTATGPLDHRQNTIKAAFQVLDPQGKVHETVHARPTADGSALTAVLSVPDDGETYQIRGVTVDKSSGVQFRAEETRALDLARLPNAQSPPSQAAKPTPHAVAAPAPIPRDDMQFLLVAYRPQGRRVLFDSQQPTSRPAYRGDHLSAEVVAAGMDPKMLRSWGQDLRARFLGDDGAVRIVPLHFEKDRYVTEPVLLREPGSLSVLVDIRTPGFEFRLEGKLVIEQIQPLLVLHDQPIFGRFGMLPVGTLVPGKVHVEAKTASGGPVPPDDLKHLLQRDKYEARWRLHDSAGRVVAGESWPAEITPRLTEIRLHPLGSLSLAYELIDGNQIVVDRATWHLEVVEPALEFSASAAGHGAEAGNQGLLPWFASQLPAVFTEPLPVAVVAEPTRSTFLSSHYVAGVLVAGTPAEFQQQSGQFICAAPQDGQVACVSRLAPYAPQSSSLPAAEIQVQDFVDVTIPLRLRWGRLGLALLAALALVVAAIHLIRFLIADPRDRIVALWADGGCSSEQLLKPRGMLGIRWSVRVPDDLLAGDPERHAGRTLATIRRRLFSGKIVARACSDGLPEIEKGQSLLLGRSGEENVEGVRLLLPDGSVVSYECLAPQPEAV